MEWDRIRHVFGRDNEEPSICRVPTQPAILNTRIAPSHVQQSPITAEASPSLSFLGSELLSIILDMIRQENPASLSSVALVNSTYYHLARYSQFRDLCLDIGTRHKIVNDTSDESTALVAYLENSGLLTAVRELRIAGKNNETSEGELSLITALLPKLTGLTDLVWHTPQPIPDDILHHLQRRPSLRLHTRALNLASDAAPSRDIVDVLFLCKLQNCTNLHSLEVVQTFTGSAQSLAVTKPLKEILLSCPNLRRLKIDIGMPTSGCVIDAPPKEYCGLGFLEGERPIAALEELDLVRYPFGMPRPTKSLISKLAVFGWPRFCDTYPLQVHEEDYWAENFDWSCLKRLVTSSSLGMRLMPFLTSVQEMDMNHGTSGDLKRFYEQVPAALQAITVKNLRDVGLEPILRHGSGLRKVQIHQLENRDWASQAVSLDDLQTIRNNCPSIEELGVDLARDGTWPYEAFDILASFPRLRHLQLWFELGIEDRENPIRPYTTFHASREIACYLFAKSARPLPCLRTIQINSGCPRPWGFGYPGPGAFWPRANSTSFMCRLSDRDDEATQQVFTATCTAVGRPGNDFLNSTQPSWSNEEFEQRLADMSKDKEAFSDVKNQQFARQSIQQSLPSISLAYNGPTPLSQWEECI